MASKNSSKTVKLAKLTQLEAEVATLSEQLRENKKTIVLLKESLAERDSRIHELESKLAYAQQSLLKKTVSTIHQCRDLIKNGIDEKVVSPALTQIQQQIEVIRGIVFEARNLISSKKMLIHENINTTSDLVHQCPDQAIRYFEKWIVEPARLVVNDVVRLVDDNVKNGQDLVEQKIIYPGKFYYERIVDTVLALPAQAQANFYAWVADPAIQKIETLPAIRKELGANAEALLMRLIEQLKSAVEQGFEKTADAIKNSSFWDGKRKMEAA